MYEYIRHCNYIIVVCYAEGESECTPGEDKYTSGEGECTPGEDKCTSGESECTPEEDNVHFR